MQITVPLLHIAYSMQEYVHRLLTSKEDIERKGLSERGEDHNHDLWYRPRPTTWLR